MYHFYFDMIQYKLLDEYDTGWKAIRGTKAYYVENPEGEEIEFGSAAISSNRRRSRLFAALCVKIGRLPVLDNPEIVPVSVAAAGKAEIAAYLWSLHYDHYTPDHEYNPVLISERLGVSEDTITKYSRRVLRSVKDQKIGGSGW